MKSNLQKVQWLFKAFLFVVELIPALPIAIVLVLFGWIGILADRYAEVSQLAAQIPFYVGEHVRYLYYKATLKKMGNRVVFKYGSFCQYRNISIGDRVLVGYYDALARVNIGNDVLIGGFVTFLSGRNVHSMDEPGKRFNQQKGKIEWINIGSDVWIGTHSVIAADVGNHCVVGTGSVVVKPVEDDSIYAGNPAKLIRKLE